MQEIKLENAVFLDISSIHPEDLDLTALKQTISNWTFFDNVEQSQLSEVINDVDVVVCNKVVLNSGLINSSRKLKLICVAATGTNNVDLNAAEKNGVAVYNVRAYATKSVVQHVFSLLLSLTTKLFQYSNAVKSGDWYKSEIFSLLDYPIRELDNRVIGIIGYGELGRAVADVAKSFGMKVLIAARDINDTRTGRVHLHTLLEKSDIVSLHCPLTDKNTGLIGEKELRRMKKSAVLINTARGGLIDETALYAALLNNEIGGAALDVLEYEPPCMPNKLIDADFENLIITPHIAWSSIESRQRLIDETAKNIIAFRNVENNNRLV